MLQELGYESLDKFIETVVPKAILEKKPLAIGEALDEQAALKKLKEYARKNILNKSFIGQGYYSSFTPPVIQRNILKILVGIHPIPLINQKYPKAGWRL